MRLGKNALDAVELGVANYYLPQRVKFPKGYVDDDMVSESDIHSKKASMICQKQPTEHNYKDNNH